MLQRRSHAKLVKWNCRPDTWLNTSCCQATPAILRSGRIQWYESLRKIDDAVNLIEYHLRRNHTAHESHRKSWLQEHKHIRLKVWL